MADSPASPPPPDAPPDGGGDDPALPGAPLPGPPLPGPPLPGAVLFCCDHNAVRSPMAEALMKAHVGHAVYVQSAGVKDDLEIDGFAVAVMREIGLDLERHRVRTMDQMLEWGDDLESYDLIVALSPASQRRALEFTRFAALEVEYWPILDPTGLGETREEKLAAYRMTRDQIAARIRARFPRPAPPEPDPSAAPPGETPPR